MRHLYLFFQCFFVLVLVGSIEYHGNRRFYTTIIDEKTYIALHALNEQIKLIFPKEKNFSVLASAITVFSPSNKKCQDTENILNFTLLIDVEKYIRGEIKIRKMGVIEKVWLLLFEKCYNNEDAYDINLIDDTISTLSGSSCFRDGAPFQSFDDTKNGIELKVNGAFNCQVFMVLVTTFYVIV
uniref:Uncharacterized protein n=1 Tax=Panagrolaimus sp. ES5 TaxID=591445 RepID=A0AC34F2V8_9BILA